MSDYQVKIMQNSFLTMIIIVKCNILMKLFCQLNQFAKFSETIAKKTPSENFFTRFFFSSSCSNAAIVLTFISRSNKNTDVKIYKKMNTNK